MSSANANAALTPGFLTTAPGVSTAFNNITANEFLSTITAKANITIVDGEAVWNQPASQATAVADGTIRNVPADWTWGRLLMSVVASMVGKVELEVSVAKLAIHRAHETECLACAAASSAQAAQDEAEDLAAAAQQAIKSAEEGVDAYAALDRAINSRTSADTAATVASEAQNVAAAAADAAVTAIAAVPAAIRPSFVATLAPDFAHLAGDLEPSKDGRPPKPSFSGVPRDLIGFVCSAPGCKAYNLVRSGKKNWYAVYVGTLVGVFYGSIRALAQVSGVSGGHQRGFYTREEAEISFADALIKGNVQVVQPNIDARA